MRFVHVPATVVVRTECWGFDCHIEQVWVIRLISGFRTMCSTILQLVWTLASLKRALTGKGEVVESDDAAYNLLALASGLTSTHCAHLPYMSIPSARAWCVFSGIFLQIYACSWAKQFWPRTAQRHYMKHICQIPLICMDVKRSYRHRRTDAA